MRIKKITIIVPCYNERLTILKTVKKILDVKIKNIKKEIIIINDGSNDGTAAELKKLHNYKNIIIINKTKNEGKGAGIKSALKIFTGDIVIIQDADLEYNPNEYIDLIAPIQNDLAEVVYGSRFIGSGAHRVLLFWHMLGNKFLTLISNALTNLNLTDMETCYKVFTKNVAKKLNLVEKRFGFEPEFTAKIAKMGVKIFEVGITYSGRGYSEGKKINWKDGVMAMYYLVKYNIFYK